MRDFFKNFKKEGRYLALILLIAFLLRGLGIGFGLPDFRFQTDESFIASNVMEMKEKGEIAPANMVYPTFIYYLLLIFAFINKSISHNELVIIGRIISLISGTLSVYLIFLIAKEIFNKKIALLAAFFLATNFLHVVNSHYLKVDVPGAFLGLLTVFFAVKLFKERRRIYYILAGVFLGLAFEMQYIQIFFIIPFLIAHILSFKKKIDIKNVPFYLNQNLWLFAFSFLVMAFVTNPYLFINFGQFFASKSFFEERVRATAPLTSRGNINTPIWYLLYFITSGLYYPIFLLTLIGVVLLIKRRKKIDFFLLSYPLGYGLFLFFFLGGYRFDRLTVSLMPFFALYFSLAVDYLIGRVEASKLNFLIKRTIFLVGLLLFLGLPLLRTSLFSFAIVSKDTRELAAEWVEKNYPKDQVIFAIADTIHIGQYLQKKGFNQVINLFPLENKEIFLYPGEILLIDSVNYHIAENYQTIPTYKKFWENYQLIKKNGKLIKEFSQPLFKAEFFSPAFLEHSSTVNAYHNPTVEIYEIPKLDEYVAEEISFEYLPEEMNHSMQLIEKNGQKFLFKELEKGGLIAGPYKLFPKGDYLLEYFIINPKCSIREAMVTLTVAFSGKVREPIESKFSCSGLEEDNRLRLDFQLNEPARLELILGADRGVSFFVEKAVLRRINYD